MVLDIVVLKKPIDWNCVSSIGQFNKSMINDGPSFRGNVISDILNEIQVKNAVALIEDFLDNSDLLSGKENSKRVEEKIECMWRHGSGIIRIKLLHIWITGVQILDTSAKKLELEFIIDFRKLIKPVHCFLKYEFLFLSWSYINENLFYLSHFITIENAFYYC